MASESPTYLRASANKTTPPAEKPHPVWVYVCGFNIAILIGAFMAVSRPVLGPRRSVPLAIVVVALYSLLVGAGASVVRNVLRTDQHGAITMETDGTQLWVAAAR